jgi:hypothetical protein
METNRSALLIRLTSLRVRLEHPRADQNDALIRDEYKETLGRLRYMDDEWMELQVVKLDALQSKLQQMDEHKRAPLQAEITAIQAEMKERQQTQQKYANDQTIR